MSDYFTVAEDDGFSTEKNARNLLNNVDILSIEY